MTIGSSTLAPPLSPYQPNWDPSIGYNAWNYFTLSGVPSPGTIVRGGVKGFKRRTGWDIKTGKGTKGATLTLKDQPPCKGSITIQLLTAADLAAWDSFVAAVLSVPTADQQTDGLSIFYPAFSSIGLTAVVIEEYDPPEYVQGKLLATITMIEWSPPPNTSIVVTPSAVGPDQDAGSNQPAPQDPRIAARLAQIAALTGTAQAANVLGPAAGGSP
jgi:hypothetical protein